MMWNFPFDCISTSNDIHTHEQKCPLFDFCINPSHEGNPSCDLYQGRIYVKATNDMKLTPLYVLVCSNDIHSQLQGNQ